MVNSKHGFFHPRYFENETLERGYNTLKALSKTSFIELF